MKILNLHTIITRGCVSGCSLSEKDGKLRLVFSVIDPRGFSHKKTAYESDGIPAETLRTISEGTRVEFTVCLEKDPQNAPAYKPVIRSLRILEDNEPLDPEISANQNKRFVHSVKPFDMAIGQFQ